MPAHTWWPYPKPSMHSSPIALTAAATTYPPPSALERAGRAAVSVPVIHDVDDVAVRCPDEEPAHAPRLCRYRFHNLVAEFLRFFIGSFDIRRVDGNDRVFRGGCVARDELDVRPGVGRGVARHPSHVELLGTQPEIARVKALRYVDVSHPEVGHDSRGAHQASRRGRCWPPGPGVTLTSCPGSSTNIWCHVPRGIARAWPGLTSASRSPPSNSRRTRMRPESRYSSSSASGCSSPLCIGGPPSAEDSIV